MKKEAMTGKARIAARIAGMATLFLALVAAVAPAADRPGDFAYWVLALSWSPSWCRSEGAGRAATEAQCDARTARGFVVHGLWPQHEAGWPVDCATAAPGPSRRETAAMADLMGSPGLAFHQWRRHGRCSGLSGSDYLALTRRVAGQVVVPPGLRRAGADAEIDPDLLEAAFLAANPGFVADGITVTCRGGLLREVRLCFDRALVPRACAPDAARDCRAPRVALPGAPG